MKKTIILNLTEKEAEIIVSTLHFEKSDLNRIRKYLSGKLDMAWAEKEDVLLKNDVDFISRLEEKIEKKLRG